MSDKKHIDRLFQERLKDFEAAPSDAVWENIEAELNKKKKKHHVIPIWWRYAGVAALLLLLLTVGGVFFNNPEKVDPIQVVETEDNNLKDDKNSKIKDLNTTENNKIVNTNNVNKTEEEVNNQESNNNSNEAHPALNTLNEQNNTSIAETNSSKEKNNGTLFQKPSSEKKLNTSYKITAPKKEETIIAKNPKEDNKNPLKENLINNTTTIAKVETKEYINHSAQNTSTITTPKKTTALENNALKNQNTALAENKAKEENALSIEDTLDKTKDIIEEEKKLNRWSVAPNAAPVYFNTLGAGSSIDPQFNNNSKSGGLNISYGISASYAINKKLRVRSGINRVNLGYNTNNVAVFQSVRLNPSSALQNLNDSANNNVSVNNLSNVSLLSTENLSAAPKAFIGSSSNTSINQSLGYIEIPLEFEYALLNKKIGVNIIGGFSSFFLNNNEVFSEAENGTRTLLGEATNINKVSYSANFGLGLNYKISKKLDLNLEPMFKYQINTFNNTSGNFQPFFIGVYTGFAIKF